MFKVTNEVHTRFRVGDKIVCVVNDLDGNKLMLRRTYTVEEIVSYRLISLAEISGIWSHYRFELDIKHIRKNKIQKILDRDQTGGRIWT